MTVRVLRYSICRFDGIFSIAKKISQESSKFGWHLVRSKAEAENVRHYSVETGCCVIVESDKDYTSDLGYFGLGYVNDDWINRPSVGSTAVCSFVDQVIVFAMLIKLTEE